MIKNDLELFRNLIDRSHDAIFVNDPQSGRFAFVNEKACTSLGYDRQELLAMSVMDIEATLPDNFSWQEHVNELRQKHYLTFEGINKRKDGMTFPVEVNISLVAINTQEYMVAIVRDVTERKRAENALQEREKQLAESQRIARIGSWQHNMKTGRVFWSDELFLLCGLDPATDPVDFNTFFEMVHPDDQPALKKATEETLRDKKPFSIDYRLIRRDGTVSIIHAQAELIADDEGEPAILSGTAQDITRQKQAEEKIRQSEERYRSLFEDSPISLWEEDCFDLQEHLDALRSSGITDFRAYLADHSDEIRNCLRMTKIISVNKATLALYEVHDQATLMRDLSKVFTTQSFESFRDILIALAEGVQTYECETMNRTLKGRTINVLLRWSLLSGAVQGSRALISIVDITERKRAEESLRQSGQFIRSILDSVDEGFLVIDRDFHIVTANKSYCKQIGEVSDRIIGRHCYEISHKILRPCYEEGEECAVRQVFDTGQPHVVIHRHVDRHGNILFVETKGYPMKDDSGKVISVIETINNITEKHLLEEERLKTQKLESIGTLAGGIAHDFNNLLQGIFGYISMAKLTLDERKKSLAMLEQAEHALHQSVSLTAQLLTFAKGGKPIRKRISLVPVVEDSAKFALSGSRSNVSFDIEPGLWKVDADKGQLGQVIQNIVLNADQAMPEGGTIAISARNVLQINHRHLPYEKEGYVEVSIRDSGIGIPENYLHKIFDPYFTTKEKGSGLGLATSYSIIRSHDGLIDVTSELGKGTTFFIYLPAVDADEELEKVSAPAPVARQGKILVMDDESLVRNVAEELIKALGHEVDLAENGEAAIEKYRAAKGAGKPFDIVILDLTVRGGMGGRDALLGLRGIDPNVSAIVSSGYSDDAVVADYKRYGFKARMTKPYRLDDLRNTLNKLLVGGRA